MCGRGAQELYHDTGDVDTESYSLEESTVFNQSEACPETVRAVVSHQANMNFSVCAEHHSKMIRSFIVPHNQSG